MPTHADTIRQCLSGGPLTARQLIEISGVSQPTVSRTVAEIGDDIVRIGAARSIHYALRDRVRGLPDIVIHRVDAEGRIGPLGVLVPVRPDGFVMRLGDGSIRHSEGLPWWLLDLRPQGYLGRAFVARHAAELGLPARLVDWSDTHALRALLVYGHDAVGDLLLGDRARDRFLAAPPPDPVSVRQKPMHYPRLAFEASRGELPGSSAGGEQPKFTVYAMTPDGPRQVIVKFSELVDGPVSERWRDLLLAEHLALETLRDASLSAARTRVLDAGGQRFLEVERFDRVGALGRRAMVSLSALDAEFVGAGTGGWPAIARALAAGRQIREDTARGADLLWAFGALIGNTDMHGGNLSFLCEPGAPCELAPAYDMTPMAFAPRSGGGLPDALAEPALHAGVDNDTWRRAGGLACAFLARVRATAGFSGRFAPCIAALERHVEAAGARIARLA